MANEVVEQARSAGCAHAESVALRALGLAAGACNQVPDAVRHLEGAVAAAEAASSADLAAEARLSLAGALWRAGESQLAISTLERVRATGLIAVQVASQRAVILAALGRYEEALEAHAPVVPGFRRLGEQAQEGWALNNRGLLQVYLGRFARAEADLVRAEQLMVRSGSLAKAAVYRQNRGFAAARQGDVARALELFAQADERLRELGAEAGARSLGRASALHAAGLSDDARQVAEEVAAQLEAAGDQAYLAECLLLLADIALAGGDPEASAAAARRATSLFERQSRPTWHALAEVAAARAALSRCAAHAAPRSDPGAAGSAAAAPPGDAAVAGPRDDAAGPRDAAVAGHARAAARAADVLRKAGLVPAAAMAHAVAGKLWVAAGDTAQGLGELDAASAGRRRGTAAYRLVAWEALGEARCQRGDRRGAMAALRRALLVNEEQRASLEATELRAHVAVHASSAARLGLGLALGTGRPQSIWTWMERHRANSLSMPAARPPADPAVAAVLAELRQVAQEIAASASGRGAPGQLLARQAELERRVRTLAWHPSAASSAGASGAALVRSDVPVGLRGNRAHGPHTPAPQRSGPVPEVVTPADMAAALGDLALIELAEVDGYLHAVVVAGGRWHCRALGPVGAVQRELGHTRLALRRVAFGASGGAFGRGGEVHLAQSAARLDDLLVAPVSALVGERSVLVVPTAELHAVPWAALPGLAGRPVAVAPSARLWARGRASAHKGRRPARAVVIAGPGLLSAPEEAAEISALYPRARLLAGAEASAGNVIAALEGAPVAHFAAHAHFRADNGLWSSIDLADGPLTVYDLERVRRPPAIVVLSACQSGLSTVRPGDEVMGFVAALLRLGTASVIASLAPVDDAASKSLMVELHRHLRAGSGPAAALAAARSACPGGPALAQACFGGA
ncbi:MAG TPA: CHAT domain-containing tetratricopeptide repeat protein [Acidimicrobiales bacterium]|nr:CHAT domain-containing tetratricopeptide repeat protein [Acidimicrobiales bacterium]